MTKKERLTIPRGRPSDNLIDRVLIEAAKKELVMRGYAAMSVESIAAQAGVSKVSLYRRWSSKTAIIAEVLKSLSREKPLEDLGSLKEDLRALLEHSSDIRLRKRMQRLC